MAFVQSLLILAAFAAPATQVLNAPSIEQRHPDAVEVFHCDFAQRHDVELSWDVNFDRWPDEWSREYGPGLPHYVDALIEDDGEAVSGKRFSVHLNGGGARVLSPSVSISDKFSYAFETMFRMEDVEYARAQIRVEFCDDELNVLQTAASEWRTSTSGWERVVIGPINPTHEDARLARVVLEVEPGKRADLKGTVSLDDIWLARQPKMVVTTNSPFNVYEDPSQVQVRCELSGILEKNPDILFELLDASSQKLDNYRERLDGRLITERLSHASDIVDSSHGQRAGYAGETFWRPPIAEHGYYRVRVTMKTAAGLLEKKVISIAVVPPLDSTPRGEFGWSLAGDDIPLSYDQLSELLPRISVNWLKLPVWYDATQTELGDKIVMFTEQLAAKDIEAVGVVDRPPASSDFAQRLQPDAVIADVLSTDTSSWLPLLDPVLTRLSLRIRWWQLGDDHDASYSTFPDLEKDISELRAKLFRFGQDVNLGIGWDWNNATGIERSATWDFQQYSAKPPLTGQELASYLQLPKRPGTDRWVLIEPLPRKGYDLETRARDLLEQVLAAKIQGADAI
ncbi:MAG: hypothetical protein KDA61_08390, partial [Planctomycetales bacterium]|nr:hypothetical protein [Planctomycetales bacterium]